MRAIFQRKVLQSEWGEWDWGETLKILCRDTLAMLARFAVEDPRFRCFTPFG